MKKAYLIHGWEGNPETCWFPWLKKELEAKGFEVVAPAMPNTEEPKIEEWVGHLKEIVTQGRTQKNIQKNVFTRGIKDVDEETYFIGHSIGCQAIMRYLETLDDVKVGGLVFVAGWFNLPWLETQEEKDIAKPWLEKPIDTDKIKKMSKKIICIFSDNDPDVPLSDSELFKERLGAEIIIEKGMGHFDDDIVELVNNFEQLWKTAKK